jgi:ferredoxin
MMTAYVDQEGCISCGACIDICPEVFKWDDNDKAVAYAEPATDEVQDSCRDAADSCPVSVIAIRE